MALVVEQILSIVTFFLTVRSMVRAWWKAKTLRYSDPLQVSPIESALLNNLVLPVQLDSLSIKSVGVPPRDSSLKQEPLILKSFEREPDTRTNGLIDLLFVKSSSDDKLYTGRQNNNVDNVGEARVDAVGCSEGTSRVRQENDEDTRTEPLPLKTNSQSSVSTTLSCRVVWVPWRVWIEHMRTAECRFEWVNPLRQLRKIWRRTRKSSNGTSGSKNEHGKNEVPQTTIVPRQSTMVAGEIAANPGASTPDKESTDKTGGKAGQDKNSERTEAPVQDRIEGASTSDKESTDKSDGKAGQDKNSERTEAPVQDRIEGASTSDKASTDNTESIQDNSGCGRVTLVEDWCSCIKYHLQWRFPFRRTLASSYAEEPAEVHVQEQTDIREGGDKKTSYADKNNKLPPEKDITAMESTSNNTTTGINDAWINDMGKDTSRMTKKGKEAHRKKSSETKESGRLKVMGSSDQSTSVTSKSQNSHVSQPSSNKVEGIKDSQNTTKNRQNRPAPSSFVRIFRNAKFRWNNPFKRTAPSNTDDLKRNGSEDHQVVQGSLESDKSRDIQETPVIAFDSVIASSHGFEGKRKDPANNPGTSTDTAPAACNQDEARDPANNPGTSTDTAPAASQVPLTTPAQFYKPASAGQPARAWQMAETTTEMAETTEEVSTSSNKVYGLTTFNSYTPASLFITSNKQQTNPANPSSTKTPLTDCGEPSGVPPSSAEPTPTLFFVSSQSQPRQSSSTIPSTDVRVAPEVPSSSTEPSKENSNKRKRFSFFRSKSRQTHQGAESKPKRFSNQRNTIRPL